MRSVFGSIRFRCCRKIYLRLCGPLLLSKLLFLRREGRHESFPKDQREVRSFIYRQRRGKESARPSHGTIAGRAAERAGIDGHERRMRRRRMRLVFPAVGRDTSRILLRSEEHTSELQSPDHLVCRLLLEKKTLPVL